ADGSTVIWSTLLGGVGTDTVREIGLDSANNVYAVGATTSGNYPKKKPVQPNRTGSGESDAFATVLNPTGSSLLFSTTLGGFNSATAAGASVYKVGGFYVSGDSTSDAFFPTDPPDTLIPALQDFNAGGAGSQDIFVARFDVVDVIGGLPIEKLGPDAMEPNNS